MTTKELRAAAEVIILGKTEDTEQDAAAVALADHILSITHPDDDEPLTREWLIERGGDEVYDTVLMWDALKRFAVKVQFAKKTWVSLCICEEQVYISDEGMARGKFRKLCEALKVELKG